MHQGSVNGTVRRAVDEEFLADVQEGRRADDPPGEGPGESEVPPAPARGAPGVGRRQMHMRWGA